jgi:hypothetical protein
VDENLEGREMGRLHNVGCNTDCAKQKGKWAKKTIEGERENNKRQVD